MLADLDPDNAGLEAATAGYDGDHALEARCPGSTWARPTRTCDRAGVDRDADRLHHLAPAEVAGRGPCLLACGYAGRLLLLHPQPR